MDRPKIVNLELEDLSEMYDKKSATELYIEKLEIINNHMEVEVEQLIDSVKHLTKRLNHFADSKDEAQVLDQIYRDSM